MSPHSAASALALDVGTPGHPWFLVELAEPREGGLADTLYLARTVEQSLLLDDGQTVQLIHPWGSS